MDSYGNIGGSSRRNARKRRQVTRNLLLVALSAVLVAGVALLGIFVIKPMITRETVPSVSRTEPPTENTALETDEHGSAAPTAYSGTYAELLNSARRTALMYDYDGAIAMVKSAFPDYAGRKELAAFIEWCSEEKAQLVKWSDNTQITHVFFHTLVVEEEKAFSVRNISANDYNMVMTTVDEFNAIIEEMYARGFVLVHLSDIASIELQADGSRKMVFKSIYLPEGKKPFVLSQDDVSYYEYMTENGQPVPGETLSGFATKLVLRNGKVTNEMAMADGSVRYGSFDMVPLLDDFVEAHPDFSYHGAKGTIALTGYNGVLGYRTSDISYGYPVMDPSLADEATYRRVHLYYNDNIEADKAEAKRVADAMKANGWKFASHTWGHANVGNYDPVNPTQSFYRQMKWWDDEVKPIVGDTDIIIFAFGADIVGWRGYEATNVLYTTMKSYGFDYFCNVDASTHAWVQLKGSVTSGDGTYVDDGYFRQGRRNLDGQRMFEDIVFPERNRLSDLFESKKVFSRKRPLPTPQDKTFLGMTLPEGFNAATMFD
ncbi:MAG: polysaccharide deacetylase [Lachnospiraceae bacterium]|nr:polysaccharide deacetylase [Lachnospiraceae bacterium]